MSSINILSYNICWECMANHNKAVHCNNDSCMRNVRKIISKNYDFVGIQEGTPYNIHNLNYESIIYKSKIRNNTNVFAILLYNPETFKFLKTTKISGLLKDNNRLDPGRLFVGGVFKNLLNKQKYLVISLHNGHENTRCNWLNVIKNKIKRKKIKNIDNIIIMGDFNENINKCSPLKLLNKRIEPINKNTNTCCDFRDKNYTYLFDNFVTNMTPETFNVITPKHFASDHLPITVSFIIESRGGGIDYEKLYLKYKQKYLKLKNSQVSNILK